MINNNLNKKGFTLIEMMVAVSIFTIVAIVISGTFLILAKSYKQIQINRTITDNLNFALDTLSLQIGDGLNHEIYDNRIVFEENVLGRSGDRIEYKLEDNTLKQCRNNNCVSFLSDEINVDHLSFSRSGQRLISFQIGGFISSLNTSRNSFLVESSIYPRN